jgi:hypothetical protein
MPWRRMNRLHLTIKKEGGNFIGFSPHRQEENGVGCKGIDFYFLKWRLHIGYWFNNSGWRGGGNTLPPEVENPQPVKKGLKLES